MSKHADELTWISLGAGDGADATPRLLAEPFPPREAADPRPLARSIAWTGLLSPVLVRRVGSDYQVVCGWRRVEAARAAGLARVPALVRQLDDAEAVRCYHEERALAGNPGWSGDAENLPRALRPAARTGGDLDPAPESTLAVPIAPEVEEALQRVLVRSRAFFEEVRVARAINVPRTEILADSIVEVAEGDGPIPVRGFLLPGAGELTAPHSVLVTVLCSRVARFLGWDDDSTRKLVLGGFLHDVGMVFVSDVASLGPRGLTQAELRTIQSHTRIGCALIAGCSEEWSAEVSCMARDHHERWNGTGYPEGKHGTDVGRSARLLGLLDAYAALVTPRPHRAALAPQYARERLEQALDRGLWDPTLSVVIHEALPRWAIALEHARLQSPPELVTRNSVELRGDLATMLAKGST